VNRARIVVGLLVAASSSAAPVLGAQGAPAPPPSVARAQAVLQAGNADSAIALLEDFYRANPNATAGWLLLGNAYRQKGDLDRALAAYHNVTVPRPARLQASFNIAGILASRGAADSALTLLESLKATGSFDMELAQTAPDLASLRSHPRFARTQWRASDFTSPFVEPVRVIHEWVAESKGDQFSWIARGIGDVDGDRVNDIVTSAPSFGAGARPFGPGRVYVYSGKSGRLLWQRTGGDSVETLGNGLEGAGDVNADGVPDVIAGAPGTGRAYVWSGIDGKELHVLRGTVQESFGTSAAGAGDQDGDGYADLLVGASANNSAGQGAGRVYLYSGRTGALLRTFDGEKAGDAFGSIVAGDKRGRATPILVGAPGAGPRNTGRVYVFRGVAGAAGTPRPAPLFVIESDTTGTALGAMFASIVGDVNGDKVPDVYASDFSNAASGPATGRIYVRSGVEGRPLLTLTGERAGDAFGVGPADAGDVDKDGYDDLVIGAWQHSSAAQSGGKIYLYSGRDGRLMRSITGRIPGETLGFDAAGIGDVDGDGTVDLLVTSSWSNIRGFRSGRMFVISGRAP
jgi:hypothetical protein